MPCVALMLVPAFHSLVEEFRMYLFMYAYSLEFLPFYQTANRYNILLHTLTSSACGWPNDRKVRWNTTV